MFAAIQHLKYKKHEVIIFNVSDKKKELDFDFDNRPHHFIDMESGEEMKVHPGRIRETYKAALNEYRHQLELKCAQYHIDLIDANIHDGYNQILKAYLVKRGGYELIFDVYVISNRVREKSSKRNGPCGISGKFLRSRLCVEAFLRLDFLVSFLSRKKYQPQMSRTDDI
jgi:hypothetical protein